MFKKFFVAAALTIALLGFGSQFNKAEAWAGRVVGIKTFLSLRQAPSVHSAELGRIANGALLWILPGYYENGFYYTEVGGYYGWVHSKYIRYEGE